MRNGVRPGYFNKDYSDLLQSHAIEKNIPPKVIFDRVAEAFQDGKLRPEERNSFNLRFKEMAEKIADSGVYTLSEKNSEILLWAHYADSHKGFCIEYDRTPNNDLGNYIITKRVEYSANFPVIRVADLVKSEAPVSKALFTKYEKWVYEKEWRMFYKYGNVEEGLPALITSIIFGLKMPDNHKRTFKNIMKTYEDVTFKEARIVEGKYELEIVEH